MPELVPSEDYGLLLPYVGEVLYCYEAYYNSAYPIGYSEGLVTLDGMLVTDAVLFYADRPYIYDAYANAYTQAPLYILGKAVGAEAGGSSSAEEAWAVCALDGSWATPSVYVQIRCCDQVMLLFRDYGTKDFDVMDYSGTILYNSKTLDCYDQLQANL